MRIVVGLLFAAAAISTLHAEDAPISIGVKAGVPITDAFETFRGNDSRYFTNTKRYLFGPTIEFHLPLRFSIEADALYKRLGYEFQQSNDAVFSRTVANSWEFPLLVKWEMLPGPVRPFVNVGGAFKHITGVHQIQTVLNQVTEIDNAVEFNSRNDIGLVFGGGVTFKMGPVRISPEFRYVRWGSETFRDPVRAFLRTQRDQGDFILGLTF